MILRSRKSVPARTPGELEAMAAAGAVVGQALVTVRERAVAGISTLALDAVAEEVIRAAGAVPSFLGYQGFTGSICASVNEEVVHGIPTSQRILQPGDLVSIDCGAVLDGWHGDSAWTFGVGQLSATDEKLKQATSEILDAGVAAMRVGARLTDISHALEVATTAAAQRHGIPLHIVDGFGGHGIGKEMHLDPYLPNEGAPGKGPRIVEGSTLAIEPMIALGTPDTLELDDGWTVVTVDGSRAAHWEHTVAATAQGPRILTTRPPR